MNSLKNSLEKIESIIKDKGNVAFVEYPIYLNVGDLLIFCGTENFLEERGIKVRARLTITNYKKNVLARSIDKNTTILLQGGGNFGDLYPAAQLLREAVVRDFPMNRIVILPQTIHFESPLVEAHSASHFRAHGDLHICARDHDSLARFSSFSPNVYLMPDMAHSLFGKLPHSIGGKGTLLLVRKDKEAGEHQNALLGSLKDGTVSEPVDWDDVLTARDVFVRKLLYRVSKLPFPCLNAMVWRLWYSYASSIVNRCALMFAQRDRVVTSRLHGHILACLTQRSNVVLDNSYGKNSKYIEAWTGQLGITTLVDGKQ